MTVSPPFFDLLNNSLCVSNKTHIVLNATIKLTEWLYKGSIPLQLSNLKIMTMFTLINGILFYNNVAVQHEGETLKGSFNALIFDNDYCYLAPLKMDVNIVIDDYMECTNKQNFNVKIQTLTF